VSQWTRDERVSANASKSRTAAWASYCARDWRLAASSPADGASIFRRRVKAAFSCVERSAACRFPPGRPACRSTVNATGAWHRRPARVFVRHCPVNIASSCQVRRPGIQSNSHVRLEAACTHLRCDRAWQSNSPYALVCVDMSLSRPTTNKTLRRAVTSTAIGDPTLCDLRGADMRFTTEIRYS
jgi:hypothetical protein